MGGEARASVTFLHPDLAAVMRRLCANWSTSPSRRPDPGSQSRFPGLPALLELRSRPRAAAEAELLSPGNPKSPTTKLAWDQGRTLRGKGVRGSLTL